MLLLILLFTEYTSCVFSFSCQFDREQILPNLEYLLFSFLKPQNNPTFSYNECLERNESILQVVFGNDEITKHIWIVLYTI